MQVTAPSLSLAGLWLIACPESPILMISLFHALLESEAIPCPGISAPFILSGNRALSPSLYTPGEVLPERPPKEAFQPCAVSYLFVFPLPGTG